ncbi:MAG: MerC domain-containing protein [Pseudomonadota bacterium]
MRFDTTKIRRRLDRFGIALAGFCLVHCIATIVVVSIVGVGGHFLLAPEIHEIGLLLAFVFACIAIGWGALVHRNRKPTLFALGGLAFMGAGLLVPHGPMEVSLTIVGVALVAFGHLLNLRAARSAG